MDVYLFIFLIFLLQSAVVDGTIYAYPASVQNKTNLMFHDQQADFGSNIPAIGMFGYLVLASPINACTPVIAAPKNRTVSYFLLVEEPYPRTNCRYAKQVFNGQKAGYDAVIIYKHDSSNRLILMGGDGPTIPSVYVLREAGLTLRDYLFPTGAIIKITPDPQFPLNIYLIPFAIVVGICFFFMVIFSIARYARFRFRERRARLKPANLKKIPTRKFQKGDEFETCAICIEEYEQGDKLRILPCNHMYHCKCVDPWLTAGKKLCPVCKQSVEIAPKKPKASRTRRETMESAGTSSQPDHTETETEPELDDLDLIDDEELNETDNENAPLLPESQREDISTRSVVTV